MHPIERLRYVARSGWAGPAALGAEAAYALADLADHEAAAVLPACRRLIERNPGCAPLWWVAAHLLTAGDLVAEAARCARALEDDPTDGVLQVERSARRLAEHGAVAEVAVAEAVVVEVDALGPGGMVVGGHSAALLRAARDLGTDVWLAAGVGRALPARLWEALQWRMAQPPRRGPTSFFDDDEPSAPTSMCDLDGVGWVVGPSGRRPLDEALRAVSCPEPPELLSRW